MRTKKIFLYSILASFIIMLFSSCIEDYRWERAQLVYTSKDRGWELPYTNGYGVTGTSFVIDVRDLSRYGYPDRIKLYDSYFSVFSRAFRVGDLPRVFLSTGRNGGFHNGHLLYPTSDKYEYIIDVNDVDYATFIEDIFYEVEKYGSAEVFVDIHTSIAQDGLIVDYEFFNNLDVGIR